MALIMKEWKVYVETFSLIHGVLKIEVMTIMGNFIIHERLPSPCYHPNEVNHLSAWKFIEKILPNTYERHVPKNIWLTLQRNKWYTIVAI